MKNFIILAFLTLFLSNTSLAEESIFGIADIHNHMLAKEGFGGNFFKGDVIDFSANDSDINICDWVGREDKGLMSFLRHPLRSFLGSSVIKKIGFLRNCYNPEAFNKQQVHYKWLKRAREGGLRLMVLQTVHNSVLCNLVRPKRGYNCSEKAAVERQVKKARKIESYIDARNGGDSKGWFRIVNTPAEARKEIKAGNLAVVLGMEIDFDDCHGGRCDSEKLKSMIDHYYGLGIRHIFITHLNDNDVGGTAMYGSRVNSIYQRFYKKNPLQVHDCSNDGYLDPLSRKKRKVICNNKGLTDAGEDLVNHMMDKKIMIDIDHLSERSLDRVLGITSDALYPVVGSHSGFLDTAKGSQRGENKKKRKHLSEIYSNGGLIAPILNTYPTTKVQDQYLNKDACDGSSSVWKASYDYFLGFLRDSGEFEGVALGSDFNGLVHSPSPRFGRKACDGNKKQALMQENRVKYPFKSFDGTKVFHKLKSSRKQFDINTDGLANIGLLPDFIEDLRQVGLSDEDIEPLFKGAEAYIRTWERIF